MVTSGRNLLIIFLLSVCKLVAQSSAVYELPDGFLAGDFIKVQSNSFYRVKPGNDTLSEYCQINDTFFRVCEKDEPNSFHYVFNDYVDSYLSHADFFIAGHLKQIEVSEDLTGIDVIRDSMHTERIYIEDWEDSSTVVNYRYMIMAAGAVFFEETVQSSSPVEELRLRHFTYRGKRYYQGYISYSTLTDSQIRVGHVLPFRVFR